MYSKGSIHKNLHLLTSPVVYSEMHWTRSAIIRSFPCRSSTPRNPRGHDRTSSDFALASLRLQQGRQCSELRERLLPRSLLESSARASRRLGRRMHGAARGRTSRWLLQRVRRMRRGGRERRTDRAGRQRVKRDENGKKKEKKRPSKYTLRFGTHSDRGPGS